MNKRQAEGFAQAYGRLALQSVFKGDEQAAYWDAKNAASFALAIVGRDPDDLPAGATYGEQRERSSYPVLRSNP